MTDRNKVRVAESTLSALEAVTLRMEQREFARTRRKPHIPTGAALNLLAALLGYGAAPADARGAVRVDDFLASLEETDPALAAFLRERRAQREAPPRAWSSARRRWRMARDVARIARELRRCVFTYRCLSREAALGYLDMMGLPRDLLDKDPDG